MKYLDHFFPKSVRVIDLAKSASPRNSEFRLLRSYLAHNDIDQDHAGRQPDPQPPTVLEKRISEMTVKGTADGIGVRDDDHVADDDHHNAEVGGS